MAGHDIIVIGASAGGVEAMARLARDLPADIPASIFVVHHFPARATSVMPAILSRNGPVRAQHARDGEPIQRNRIYVAPPDYHLLLRRDYMSLTLGPRENGHRPAVDPLFRTAARVYGPRVVAVVLSGALDDGTAGAIAVKAHGGTVVVQSPDDALYPAMPESVLEHAQVDFSVRISEMGALLDRLARTPVEEGEYTPMNIGEQTDISEHGASALATDQYPGTPSAFTCPECGGALWEVHDGELIRYRCHVGHGYSAEGLLQEQASDLEATLWSALRALEENAALARRLARRSVERDNVSSGQRFSLQAQETEQRARLLRTLLTTGKIGIVSPETTAATHAERPDNHAKE